MFRIAVCEFVRERGDQPERGVVVEHAEGGDPLLFFPMSMTSEYDVFGEVHSYVPLYNEGTMVVNTLRDMMATPPTELPQLAGEAIENGH